MKNYNTQQRYILLTYFEKHIDKCFSSLDIIKAVAGEQISESAVYRNLKLLEKEGRLRRITKKGDRKTYYQYIDSHHCNGHIHIACIRCGETMHVSTTTTNRLAKKVMEETGFSMNNEATIIYGVCDKCNK